MFPSFDNVNCFSAAPAAKDFKKAGYESMIKWIVPITIKKGVILNK